ncbi:uncharacterized protein AB675_867 [Cyphellophora attinorum]|uniref:Uncharacterized protein n=1 Tax=Cyphellophora attinorum TaxID=1664694 RepID=A0A0N0NSA9_9EURO|nr:uncharacterized protein AB675_867 [Phialophora attinorum]KPI46041.1 hypothetical protein AB675_867 [Phialophora attinorum]
MTESVWGTWTFSPTDPIVISSIWHDITTGPLTHVTRPLSENSGDIAQWLRYTDKYQRGISAGVSKDNSIRCVLRVAWIRYESKTREVRVPQASFEDLIHALHFRQVLFKVKASYSALGSKVIDTVRFHCFSNHPRLILMWSTSGSRLPTSLVCIAEQAKIDIFQTLLKEPDFQRLAGTEVVPALLCAQLSRFEIDQRLTELKSVVREVEVRTGHHRFYTRVEPPALGDLCNLAAAMSGSVTRAASATRKLGIIRELISFALDEDAEMARSVDDNVSTSVTTGEMPSDRVKVQKQLHSVRRQMDLQELDLEYTRCRINTQREAVLHLISADDANTSNKVASDARAIALASRQISASMHILAVISVCFLPATFVASLFSMPLFDWQDDIPTYDDVQSGPDDPHAPNAPHDTWRSRLALYAAVTVPLTLLTYLIWWLWSVIKSAQVRDKRVVQEKMEMPFITALEYQKSLYWLRSAEQSSGKAPRTDLVPRELRMRRLSRSAERWKYWPTPSTCCVKQEIRFMRRFSSPEERLL